ncbi:sigma-70 family RNA polymerase sigma factor [Paenibacillus alginolyticus]|nr:sigma-70 family RNA polymerase sigma factor [Paenibacillus alginolyticus]MEC0147489.1 sigma-70 family RNA polymerase sigma factor [Paenibacillus alginolyticus]
MFSLFRSDVYKLNSSIQRTLFITFRDFVYKKIYFMTRDHEMTEDVIQESFIKALRAGPRLKQDSNLRAWVSQISRNTTYDFIRSTQKYSENIHLEFVMNSNESDLISQEVVERSVETLIRNETLLEAIQELKYEYRIALLLYYIEELSYKEIIKELGISHDVLMKRLSRARIMLAQVFINKWGDGNESAYRKTI